MNEQSLAVRQAIGVEKLGEIMFKSGYWQDTRSQAQAIVKILAGAELDFGPITSMNGVYIIEGKTTLAANLVGAAIQRSGRYRYRVVEHDDEHCTIDFFEIVGGKREKLGTSSFSQADARAADLLGKRTRMWEKFPRNMVFSRALTNGARWYTPDVFGGPVYTPDELGAEVNMEGNVVERYEPPEAPAEASVPTRERVASDTTITSADDRYWKRWQQRRSEALQLGVVPAALRLPIGRNQLVAQGAMLNNQIEAKKARLDRDEAARAAALQEREATPAGTPVRADGEPHALPVATVPPPAPPSGAWERNRALMAEAYAAGLRLQDLPNTAGPEEVEVRNAEIEQLIFERLPEA
jgi:hypothetical protein